MKVYIIASSDSLKLARIFLGRTNARLITSFGVNHLTAKTQLDIQSSDAIVVMIDETFSNSKKSIAELNYALSVAADPSNIKSPLIVPILVDDAPTPPELDAVQLLKCNSHSVTDIRKIRKEIVQLLQMRSSSISAIRLFDRSRLPEKYILGVIGFSALLMGLGIPSAEGVLLKAWESFHNSLFPVDLSNTLLFIGVTLITISGVGFTFSKDYNDSEAYSQKLKEAIIAENRTTRSKEGPTSSDKPTIDALGRMLINLEDINEYYKWSQQQAKASFYFAVFICLLGFGLFAVALLLLLSSDANWGAAIVSAVGGVVSELIAGTALIVYKNSLMQLNHYHQALHEDERFLSSVNLLNRFSTTETQDEMLKELIRSEIQMNLNASAGKTVADASKDK